MASLYRTVASREEVTTTPDGSEQPFTAQIQESEDAESRPRHRFLGPKTALTEFCRLNSRFLSEARRADRGEDLPFWYQRPAPLL